jgi:hypothetical protein
MPLAKAPENQFDDLASSLPSRAGVMLTSQGREDNGALDGVADAVEGRVGECQLPEVPRVFRDFTTGIPADKHPGAATREPEATQGLPAAGIPSGDTIFRVVTEPESRQQVAKRLDQALNLLLDYLLQAEATHRLTAEVAHSEAAV